MLLKKKI